MKNFLLLLLIVVGGYKAWGHYQAKSLTPLYEHPYVVVYGRETCGFTQQTIAELNQAGVSFQYLSVDDRAVAASLHARMAAVGLNTAYYLLPVVDINNSIVIRPDNREVIDRAKSL